jgi:hypothetical protein
LPNFATRFTKKEAMKKKTLLKELSDTTRGIIERAKQLERMPEATLHHKTGQKQWSALECLDHLNRYGDFYLPEIEKAIAAAPASDESDFKSGWLGNKSAMSMLPQKGGLKKMKTFKRKNPTVDGLRPETLKTFIAQQQAFLKLLEQSAHVNLTKTKTSTTLPLLRFRLGDTLRFVIYHNGRHMQQAERAIHFTNC